MPGDDFGTVAARCRGIAVDIQQGRWREGLTRFQPLVTTLQAGLADLPRLAKAKGLRLEEIQINDLSLGTFIRTVQGIMVEVNGAVKKHDWTTLADLLEEDLASAIDVLHEVRKQLAG